MIAPGLCDLRLPTQVRGVFDRLIFDLLPEKSSVGVREVGYIALPQFLQELG